MGHYRVGPRLGGGGMGVVYEAEDTALQRKVALKFLPSEWSRDEHAKSRFLREARLASSIDHPNICTVYQVDETEDGQLFIAMAFYNGETFKQKIAEGPLDADAVRDVAIQVARGLAKAHERGIVHRDIKPANLMMTEDGVVKVLDFGVAKIGSSTLTAPGMRSGTVPYMSPEQIRGERVDGRSDIWSLGVTLHEMVTGDRAFDSEEELAVMYSVLNEEPPSLSETHPGTPGDLIGVIERCLAKDPSDRFQSADEILTTLGDQVRRVPMSRWHPSVWLSSPVSLIVIVAAAVVLMLDVFKRDWAATTRTMDVAVLPFESIGADRDLVDGMAFAVTSGLTSMARVAGGLSVVPFRDVVEDNVASSRDARERFGISHTLTGSVQHTGVGHVITLDLTDAATGRNVDSRQALVPAGTMLPFASSVDELLAQLFKRDVHEEALGRLAGSHTDVDAAYNLFLRAQGHLQKLETDADLEIAIGLLQEALSEDPDFALAYATLGQAYLRRYSRTGKRTDMDKALQAGLTAVDIQPDLLEGRVTLGKIYTDTGRLSDAEVELTEALRIDSSRASIHHALAVVFVQQGRLTESERRYIIATQLAPQDWRYHNALGVFYHQRGDHEKALTPFATVVSLRPRNAWGYNNVGAQYHRLGNLDEAAEWYERARNVNPEATGAVANATRNAAGIYYTRGDFERASELYENAVAMDDRSLDGWENLGNAYHWSGRREDARRAWEKVVGLAEERLAVNPIEAHALEYLSETYAKIEEPEKARAAVAQLLAMGHIESSALINIVKTYEILGERDSALVFVRRAVDAGASASAFEASVWLRDLREDSEYARVWGRTTTE